MLLLLHKSYEKERMFNMSILKRIFLIAIFIICISLSFCYAIDENQLSSNQYPTSESQVQTEGSNQSYETNTAQTSDTNVENNTDTSIQETTNTTPTSRSENQSSTTVGNVSSNSKTSTITNILNIALLVVGLLLVFLAIGCIEC